MRLVGGLGALARLASRARRWLGSPVIARGGSKRDEDGECEGRQGASGDGVSDIGPVRGLS